MFTNWRASGKREGMVGSSTQEPRVMPKDKMAWFRPKLVRAAARLGAYQLSA
jgi:hypothetical protein